VFSILAGRLAFVDVFLMMRLASVLMALMVVPGSYVLAREVTGLSFKGGLAASLVVVFRASILRLRE
jgi:hypothetical protein